MIRGKLRKDEEAEKNKKQNEEQQDINKLENLRKEIDIAQKELGRCLPTHKEKMDQSSRDREMRAQDASRLQEQRGELGGT